MKERGIIFNAEMVRAILDGRKTQTRQMIDWRRTRFTEIGERDDGTPWPWSENCEKACDYWHECPFGDVGDRLWVRETWQGTLVDYENANKFYKDPEPFQTIKNCVYKADAGPCPEYFDADDNLRYGWKSSAQMPRWASRILLEITGVRVERLQDISGEDARSEGFICDDSPAMGDIDEFSHIWKSIYGENSWQANPWVWVIEFKQIQEG